MRSEEILGIHVTNTNYDEFYQIIKEDIENNQKRFIVAINPEKLIKASKDSNLKELINAADYKIVDGIGVIFASKILRGNVKDRITGIGCMEMLCEKTREINAKIFLYGAKPGVADNARVELENRYPGINIVGTMDGYEKDNQKVIDTINQANPDILFVALGSPKQEYWIRENIDKLNVKIAQGVGGSYDVISGNINRAPDWMQKFGIEWFYRLLKEPSRLPRQLRLLNFFGLVIKDKYKNKK